MRITKKQLKRIIKEEYARILKENEADFIPRIHGKNVDYNSETSEPYAPGDYVRIFEDLYAHPRPKHFGLGEVIAVEGENVTVKWEAGHSSTHQPRDLKDWNTAYSRGYTSFLDK